MRNKEKDSDRTQSQKNPNSIFKASSRNSAKTSGKSKNSSVYEELRSAQQRLETSRKEYIELYELSPVAYFTIDLNGFIKDVNQAGLSLLELPKTEILKKKFISFISSPSDKVKFISLKKQTFLTQVRQECVVTFGKIDDVFFFARLESSAVDNVDGSAGRIRIAVTNITQLKKAEDSAEEC